MKRKTVNTLLILAVIAILAALASFVRVCSNTDNVGMRQTSCGTFGCLKIGK